MGVDTCLEKVFALIDELNAAMEPERLTQISLGQVNLRMRMNAALGCYSVSTRTLTGFRNAALRCPFRAKFVGAVET